MTNFNRFQPVPGAPRDVAAYGYTKEEFAIQMGTPPKEVTSAQLNPLVGSGHLQTGKILLATAGAGSDDLRLSTPAAPPENPYEPKYQLSLSRNFVDKLGSPVVASVSTILQSESVVNDPNVKDLMVSSLSRVAALRDIVNSFNIMGERIDAKRLSVSKG